MSSIVLFLFDRLFNQACNLVDDFLQSTFFELIVIGSD
jgi:hypothetical protein